MSDFLATTIWAVTEFADADLGDLRRTQRLLQLAHVLAPHPGAARPEACGSGAMLKAAYRPKYGEAVIWGNSSSNASSRGDHQSSQKS